MGKSKMMKTLIAAAVGAALLGSSAAIAQTTPASQLTANSSSSSSNQDQSSASGQSSSSGADKKAQRLDTVVVSGSLINDAQIQTAAPVYTITAQQIQSRGFNSVQEVLQSSVFATGTTASGPQNSGGFAQGAQTISLYGLSPEYTLTLIDGKPITQFGQLYTGQSNFNNLSNIPISMIDHIDILPGGGSSIYGSSAIAGVVNIVTKQHMDGAEIVVRTGNYHNGGGANQRIAVSFGHDYGQLNVLGSLEFDNASPTWASQVPLTAANPTRLGVAWVPIIDNGAEVGYINPPNGCGALQSLYSGTTGPYTVAGRTGYACGSRYVDSVSTTLQNQSRSYDAMLKLRYNLSDNVRFYSDILADWQQQAWAAGAPLFGLLNGGLIEDPNGDVLEPNRSFSPEETGGMTPWMNTQDDLMYQADIGANGTFGDSGWDWDVYYLRSGDHTMTGSPYFTNAGGTAYWNNILGPSLGTDPNTGLNIYNANWAQLFTPITPKQFAGLIQNYGGESNTWVNNSRITLSNSELFALPGGNAGVAWIAEGGNEAWYEPANAAIAANQADGLTANSGGGERDHYDSAFEFNLPLLKQLTLDTSARYDYYTVPGASNHSFTYRIGLEYRPLDTLLLRGNYSTSFLAPDLSSLYLGPTGSYNPSVIDYYLCDTQGGGKNCTENYTDYVFTTQLSNKQLKPTTASSWTGGFVWAPWSGASLSVDYLHIAIHDEVALQDTDQLMQQDAQCLLGSLPMSSSLCKAIVGVNGQGGQVTRDPYSNQVTNLSEYYVNISNELTESLTAEAKYAFQPTHVGQFSLQLDYNDMLKHAYQIYPGSTPINMLADPLYSYEFKSIVSGSLTWTSPNGVWSSTAYWHRYGPSPNYDGINYGANTPGAARVSPWMTWNWSMNYDPPRLKGLELSVLINNVMNKMPPRDAGWYGNFPYYNSQNYNPYGREIMLQADWRFGGKKE
jgi:iron complex outermembrane recepter protein